jgi:hypothetical protein
MLKLKQLSIVFAVFTALAVFIPSAYSDEKDRPKGGIYISDEKGKPTRSVTVHESGKVKDSKTTGKIHESPSEKAHKEMKEKK